MAYLDSRRADYPLLSNALAVYGEIFSVQSRAHDQFEPMCPDEFGAEGGDRPTVPGSLPGLDADRPLRVLAEISDVLVSASPDRRSEIESARASCERNGALLRRSAGSMDHLSSAAQTLVLLALNPFYEKLARKVIPHIEERVWKFGQCLVCGDRPSMAGYEGSIGARFVQCRLCRTQWQAGRIRCAFCGCEDPHKLGYLQAENDRAHRADTCDSCRGYLKAVDERALGTEAILHVEELLMTALDREAIARGYAPR